MLCAQCGPLPPPCMRSARSASRRANNVRTLVMSHESSRVCSYRKRVECVHCPDIYRPPPPPCLYIYTLVLHTMSRMIQQYKLRGEICIGLATLFSYVLPRPPLAESCDTNTIPGLPQSCCSSSYTSVFSLQVFFRTLSYLHFSKGWSN
jgi:hypothetical protein